MSQHRAAEGLGYKYMPALRHASVRGMWQLVAEFTPQRWFYIDLATSAATLVDPGVKELT